MQRLLLVIIALLIFVGGYRLGLDHAKSFYKTGGDAGAPAGVEAHTVFYDDLPGWSDDLTFDAVPADWDDTAAAYFETHFYAQALSTNGADRGLMTGYYAPVIDARLTAASGFETPLFARPDDLVSINLAQFDPALKGKSIHGRWDDRAGKFVPYQDRAEIGGRNDLVPVAFVKDDITRFFLQIQGSGLLRLEDGRMIRAAYAGKNGRPYHAIGRDLIASGAIAAEDMSMQAIRDWLYDNPDQAGVLMDKNPAYVFFKLSDDITVKGAANVGLVADQSVAVDPAVHAYGQYLYVLDVETGQGRIVRADDTGSAIKGPLRLDLYRGLGEDAALKAGPMKQTIKLYRFVRRPAYANDEDAE